MLLTGFLRLPVRRQHPVPGLRDALPTARAPLPGERSTPAGRLLQQGPCLVHQNIKHFIRYGCLVDVVLDALLSTMICMYKNAWENNKM